MVIYLFFNLLINLSNAASKLEGESGATSTWELLEKYDAFEVRRDKEFLKKVNEEVLAKKLSFVDLSDETNLKRTLNGPMWWDKVKL